MSQDVIISMGGIYTTFLEKKGDLIIALLEHLELTIYALVIAIVIALPLAIGVAKHKKVASTVIYFTSIFQTIPSLALLGLFIPLFGIGKIPALITLVIYAIFPILQNTITGLQEIDPSLEEAADAFGMSMYEKLKNFEIPIATPIIISGVRSSAVLIIGTATLASLIGAGGLGSFILLGIDRNNIALIVIGAGSTALLAIIINYIIKLFEKWKIKFILQTLFVAMLITSIFFNGTNKMKNTIVIGGKLGTEPEILINMYKELIEDNSDLNVEVKPNFGKTIFLYDALRNGNIDIYPEFTGTITSTLLKNKIKVSNDPKEVYEVAKKGILQQDNLVLLEPMIYQNTYALAVTKKFSERNGVEKISDLKKYENQVNAGFTLEFNDRIDGNRGIKEKYGINLKVSTLEPSLTYKAITSGKVEVINVDSTNSKIKVNDLYILKDDLGIFPPYQGAALMRKETADKYPKILEALSKLSNQITEEEIIQLNYDVEIRGINPNKAARDFLIKKGMIKEKK